MVRCKERNRSFRLGQGEKFELVKHGWDTRHEILFAETKKQFHTSNWGDLVRELLEIRMTVGVLNREEGLRLSLDWLLGLSLIGHVLGVTRAVWLLARKLTRLV